MSTLYIGCGLMWDGLLIYLYVLKPHMQIPPQSFLDLLKAGLLQISFFICVHIICLTYYSIISYSHMLIDVVYVFTLTLMYFLKTNVYYIGKFVH